MAGDRGGLEHRPAAANGPLVSVIIPAFGRPRFLAEAVRSVLMQSVTDLECIVVDDASPEPVEIGITDPRVRLIRREMNGGPAVARNTGLLESRGRFVAFCDDDDLYTPRRLEIGLRSLERAPLAVCWLEPVGKGITPKLRRSYARSENRILEGDVHGIIVDRLPPHLGQITVARERMLSLPLDPRFQPAEDIDWWIRASAEMEVATTPQVGYRLRRHDLPRQNLRHEVRVRTNRMLLDAHAAYFASHPKGAARRWRLQAKFAERMGDRAQARDALRRSLSLDRRASTVYHLARSYVPGLSIGA
jgi:glycosyltransferase involved in cell wall biosynthesis